MAVIDTFTDVSGDGVLTLDGGFANAVLVVIQEMGIAQQLLQGGEHRYSKIGWIALGDDVSSIIGETSPVYAWRNFTWIQFLEQFIRHSLAVTWDVNGYPNALNYHFYTGVHADIYSIRET